MSTEVLADQAVSLLRKLFTDTLNTPAAQAATTLAQLLDDGLSEASQDHYLREFQADPTDDETSEHLNAALRTRLTDDGFFRNAVGREIDKALRAGKTAPAPTPPARDANGNLIHGGGEEDDESYVARHLGSAVFWTLNAAVAIALAYGGIHLYSSVRDYLAAGGMDEDTPCSEFLAEDRDTQFEAFRQLAVKAGYRGPAYEAFSGAEPIPLCYMSRDKTLGQVIGYPG